MSTVFEAMKLSSKQTLRLIFPYEIPPIQHRDVIRIYTMGWLDSMKMMAETSITDKEKESVKGMVRECLIGLEAIADLDWLPDDSWKWW